MTDQKDLSKLVRDLYDAINRRDVDAFDRIVSERVEYTEYGLNETMHGREAFKEYFQKWWEAFPNGSVKISNLIASNDQVAIEATGSGLQSGAFETDGTQVNPTNRTVDFHFCKVFRIEDGLIISGRSYSDAYKLLSSASSLGKVA